MDGQPVFLVGAERSGLQLLGLMLGAHPEIAWGGEFDWAIQWEESEHAEWPPLIPYWQQIALSARARALRVSIDPALGFPDLVRSLLDQQRARAGAPTFAVTVHGHSDRLLRLWPAALFLYLKRTGPRAGDRLGDADAARLREAERAWRRIAAEIAPGRRLELRYEELVSAPAAALPKVCAFIGVPYDAAMLRRPPVALGERSREGAATPFED